MDEYVVRRIEKIENRQDAMDDQLLAGAKTMARHETMLQNICDYQDKQNGCLRRLEDRFNSFYHLLLVALLGMVANLVITLYRVSAR